MNTLYALLFVTFSHITGSDLFIHESWKHPVNFNSLEDCEFTKNSIKSQARDKFEAVCLPISDSTTK